MIDIINFIFFKDWIITTIAVIGITMFLSHAYCDIMLQSDKKYSTFTKWIMGLCCYSEKDILKIKESKKEE